METTGYYWIKCDIDGCRKKWRLAVERDRKLYFPKEDFEPFADDDAGIEVYHEEFPDHEIRSFEPPED